VFGVCNNFFEGHKQADNLSDQTTQLTIKHSITIMINIQP